MSDIKLLTKAYRFAAKKHKDQRRKGVEAEPYINHPAQVANILAQANASMDCIIAGVLHDTVEDTQTSYEELVEEFGQKIADIVMEATDDKNLSKSDRKRLQVETMSKKSLEGKKVKIADKISNLLSMVVTPPDWPVERKVKYFEWAYAVVEGGRGTCRILEKQFDDAYNVRLNHLKDSTK